MASLRFFDPAAFRLYQAGRVWKILPAGARILEVGCGAGQFIRAIKNFRPDLRCFGCDISALALENARQSGTGVDYEINTVESLPYSVNEFDAVLIFDVLEHAGDVPALLAEINRVLKPGGYLYSYIPCEGDWLSFWRYLSVLSVFKELTKNFAGHINRWSRRRWREVITGAGFSRYSSRYSEHLIGQTLNVATFWAMGRFAKEFPGQQINNEFFFSHLDQTSGSRIIKFLKFIVNSAVYAESFLWQLLPSPNWHAVWTKDISSKNIV